ncbi:hypothetical protein Tco_0780781 [Tanacetum coccineum]
MNPFDPPEFLEIDDIVSDLESVDTPLVSPFLDSDDESDDGEVVNEIYLNNEYFNRQISSFTYTTDFTVFEDIKKYIEIELSEVVMGKPFKDLILEDKMLIGNGLKSLTKLWDLISFKMPARYPGLNLRDTIME